TRTYIMKNLSKILWAATFTAAVGLAIQAKACDDVYAASPKVRQTLNERVSTANSACCSTPCCMSATKTATKACSTSTSASTACGASTSTTSSCHMSKTADFAENTADDAIAASPKVRQQLNERSGTFTVAPMK